MLILPEEINKILVEAGNDITKRGKKYFEQGRVKIKNVEYKDDNNYKIKVQVEGTYIYSVNVSKKNGVLSYNCNCPAPDHSNFCKHIIAVLFDMYIDFNKYLEFKNDIQVEEFEVSNFLNINTNNKIITYYESLEYGKSIKNKNVKLVPRLDISGIKNNTVSVSLKIGIKRLYNIKDIFEFGTSFFGCKKTTKYGKELQLNHEFEEFDKNSQQLLKFICTKTSEYYEFAKLDDYFSLGNVYKNKLVLRYGTLDEFFDLLKEEEIEVTGYDYTDTIKFVEEDPVLDMEILENEKSIILKNNMYDDYSIYQGKEYNYILYKDKLYRCSEEYSKKMLPVLNEILYEIDREIVIPMKNATSFCEYVVPNISKFSNINVSEKVLKKHKAESLVTKIYLDINEEGSVIAEVKFCYLDVEFNPFKEAESSVNVNRNRLKEEKVKEILKLNKFKINRSTGRIYISNDEDIYEFMQNGINTLTEKFEVLVTDRLKTKNIINPKVVSMGLKIKSDLLEIELDDLGFDEKELASIIKSYRLKKKFYRLKDGSFVNIDSSGIDTLVNITDSIGINEKDVIKGKITVPKYRAIYLDEVIKSSDDINARKDTTFKEIVRNVSYAKDLDFDMPKSMQNILREYQKIGYNWLKTLDICGFGGILADDMGLGKTLQVIALLEQERLESKKTSIVVCPSSLYINWEKEINKFAPDLKVCVIYGNANKREELIKKLDKYDVVITSYDLLKRDIENYSNYNFKYIIADEAQYIKNNNTKNAKALKELKGTTRFALTGTPMENSLSELWSIFDFCMPGYLFSYNKFRERIESKIIKDNDKEAIEKLNTLVSPFILRRTKKEVLKELPEKIETKMYNVMNDKQEKIYKSYLAQAKKEMELEIEENGFEKSKLKILSLITRLRQICCHPSLFLEDYDGESSKLEQCVELVEDACISNHKILIFSQFTSMFDILKKEFKERNIKYYELTGKTKAETRVELVDKFNKEKDVQVFLVSLKAGGTGLNLIGADMVIHFDPWWNLSVQNQATDRAYRIGQRNNVQVFSLITQNSIEEKISKLQETKQKLADNIVKTGETFISKMNKEEIMELFE